MKEFFKPTKRMKTDQDLECLFAADNNFLNTQIQSVKLWMSFVSSFKNDEISIYQYSESTA